MPFVRMVALSGSLAHLNAEGSADLDLFVITAPHRVWSVTVATLVLSKLLGWRKHVCMNYVVSESAMAIAPRDLFSANQIIHLRPIVGGDVFTRFLEANPFVKSLYPNFPIPSPQARKPASPSSSAFSRWVSRRWPRRLARGLYGWHLRRRAATWQSRDQVRLEPECLKLHTSSHRATTLQRFDDAMDAALLTTKVTKASKNTKPLEVMAS